MRRTSIALAGCLLLAAALPAQAAHHIWRFNGAWVHQHTRTFGVYQQLGAATDAAADASLATWDAATVLSLPVTTCHGCSRIHELEGNYGATGWVGLASVESAYDGATGHYSHGHATYNLFYAEFAARRLSVTCHEQGHLLGLDHDFDVGAFSCMADGYTLYTSTSPSSHDIDTINSRYPATGH